MTATIHTDFTNVEAFTKDDMNRAHKAFVKNPSATNWDVCTRAMFTHQQLQYAKRSPSVDREKLAFDLDANPVGAWQDIISRATCGEDIYKAMN
jgi:hypothetical protein